MTEQIKWFENRSFSPNEIIKVEDSEPVDYKSWIDLCGVFHLKMLTPEKINEKKILLKFQKLDLESSFHKDKQDSEKYGTQSQFFTINKKEKFSFLYHYQKALEFINIKDKRQILNLGINKGDEFEIIKDLVSLEDKELVGIDYSESIINYAKENIQDRNIEFICHDINKLSDLNLPKSDLIISIGTLQSSNLNFKEVFMDLYQNHLEKDGAIILGFPNCRWIDSEMIYGAKAPNYPFSEMSLVIKDIYFSKKYLQQKKYRVTVTGKDYLFLTARKIGL
ncbi:MAG: class I SAM-dependent methyltransferase [Campylobacterales bacterium]|nr:class I SAM-dependent methyltransferase [Campylobacterales bacterium]